MECKVFDIDEHSVKLEIGDIIECCVEFVDGMRWVHFASRKFRHRSDPPWYYLTVMSDPDVGYPKTKSAATAWWLIKTVELGEMYLNQRDLYANSLRVVFKSRVSYSRG